MSRMSFELSHFTGKTTWILSALQGLIPSSDWFDLKFRWRILKSYTNNMLKTFLWNNYFLTNFCFVKACTENDFKVLLILSSTTSRQELGITYASGWRERTVTAEPGNLMMIMRCVRQSCFVLLTRGWRKLHTKPPVALGPLENSILTSCSSAGCEDGLNRLPRANCFLL